MLGQCGATDPDSASLFISTWEHTFRILYNLLVVNKLLFKVPIGDLFSKIFMGSHRVNSRQLALRSRHHAAAVWMKHYTGRRVRFIGHFHFDTNSKFHYEKFKEFYLVPMRETYDCNFLAPTFEGTSIYMH